MRLFLIIAGIIASTSLVAQKKQVQSAPYTQNEPPVQQSIQTNCFEKNYDAGLSNIRRGDYRNALHILEDAKNCPDAVVSSRRMTELESLIDFCKQKLTPVKNQKSEAAGSRPPTRVSTLDATTPEFVISPALRHNTDPNCFQLTVREADRAFRDSVWETAAKLYRAAKNCEDANQTDRERMNERIAKCDAAAKDVLLQKEQKAVRLARHATASNLAAQAMNLLRQGNRSLAFRLADFANFYIAPDDNPDCLEAMYASFFNAQVRIEGQTLQLPFCYQLSSELSFGVQLKFIKFRNRLYLKAYEPGVKGIYTWELPSMKLVEGYAVSTLQAPTGFDVAPDGSLLLFNQNKFYLENGQITLDVPSVRNYCFSEENDFFFYQDTKENIIRALPLSTAASYSQFRKNGNISRAGQQSFYLPCQENLLTLSALNDQIWLGYPDRIEVYDRPSRDEEVKPRVIWRFAHPTEAPVKSMVIYPERREAVIAIDTAFIYYFLHLPMAGEDTIDVDSDAYPGMLFASSPGSDTLITFSVSGFQNGDKELTILNPGAKQILQRFVYRDEDGIILENAAISPGGDWLATVENNAIRLMPLGDKFSTQAALFPTDYADKLSSDGEKLISSTSSELMVYDASNMDKEPKHIGTNQGTYNLPKGESKQWVVYQKTETQLELVHGDKRIQIPCGDGGYNFHCFAFDDTEQKYFACSNNQVVTVYSLPDGAVLTHKEFPGEIINLQTLPESGKLLVVHINQHDISRTSIKVWNVADSDALVEPVHLEGYNVLDMAVSNHGDYAAFTDGLDIHVFSTGNWSNESLVINIGSGTTVSKIRFRPDGAALAGGCNDGEVFIWNIYNGQPILKFLNSWKGMPYPVLDLAFSSETGDLQLLSQGVLFSVPVDAGVLHNYVLNDNRWLKTFTSSQIRDYGLETAFKYPGNLEKLTQSGDQLLIGSFLEFFREQSAKSFNIAQVRTYCQQAGTFLDALGSNSDLQEIHMQMYRDLINKCLVRNDLKEANTQLAVFARRFGNIPAFKLMQAHLSLLEGNTENASHLYSSYLISTYQNDKFDDNLKDIEQRLTDFNDAGLLDSARMSCICSVFRSFLKDDTFCSKVQVSGNSIAEQASRYQSILSAVHKTEYLYSIREKVLELEAAYAEASKLDYPNPLVSVHPLEFSAIALAGAYVQDGVNEHNTPKTPQYFEKAVNLLEKIGPFKNSPDTARLAWLANTELLWSNYLLLSSHIPEAVAHLKKGLASAQKLAAMYQEESLNRLAVEGHLEGPLLAALCEAQILEGNAPEARRVLDQGKDIIASDLESTLSGRVSLLEKDSIQAFLDFGVLSKASEIGPGMYNIRRMAEQLPDNRDYLNLMIQKLKDAFLSIHPRLQESQIDYYESIFQVEHFAAMERFDSTLVWAAKAHARALELYNESNDVDSLRLFYLNQCLSESYYRVMVYSKDTSQLSATIHMIENAFSKVHSNNFEDTNLQTYLYTNLGHAHWLRNRGDDHVQAVKYYLNFRDVYGWEPLIKDFIDLHRGGVNWPNLEELLQQILPNPDVLSAAEKHEMGL